MKEFNRISIKSMYKSFGKLEVLNDFNLTIEKGEFVTFLGPSGCGKSTALNCISGLIKITSGEIYVDDQCIDNSLDICIPPEKRKFGMVFQSYALFPHLTVFQNIAFGLEIKKLAKSDIKNKVESALELVQLQGYGDKYPGQLSGGQQQRVAIARCMVLEPRLLMLDEPLSNLDAKLRIEMRYELKALHERLQISTIYVTHDQHEALALSDKIVVMKRGCVQQIGTPQEVYSNPSNLFVADFMGFKNLWSGKIENYEDFGDSISLKLDINGLKLTSIIGNKNNSKYAAKKFSLKEAYLSNSNVTIAIRPEDIVYGSSNENNFSCNVLLIEYLGKSSEITGHINHNIKVVAKPEGYIEKGDNINLHVEPSNVIVFSNEGVK
jgi:putative spermidine/putrescine transport system ATP-binding protein